MQPIRTIWTTLVGDHPGIIPMKFGQNPMSGFRGEDVKVKKFTHDDERRTKAGHNSSPWGELKSEIKLFKIGRGELKSEIKLFKIGRLCSK